MGGLERQFEAGAMTEIPICDACGDPVTKGILHGTWWLCSDCAAAAPYDHEQTVPDRNVPPSQRDLSTHEPGCNCMGCFYDDR